MAREGRWISLFGRIATPKQALLVLQSFHNPFPARGSFGRD